MTRGLQELLMQGKPFNNQAEKKIAVKFMSMSHKIALLFLAALILSVPVMAESRYTINVSADKFLGEFLVNQSGFTLYTFSDDGSAMGLSTCYDDCSAKWSPFYVETISLPDSLMPGDFASITRTDGLKQTTFRGWPLYLYSGDRDAGDVFGDGREENRWHVVSPLDLPQLI